MKFILLILYTFASVAHGAPGIHLRPVFEKSANGIFDQNKDRFGALRQEFRDGKLFTDDCVC